MHLWIFPSGLNQLTWEGPLKTSMGHRLLFQNKFVFLSLKIVFVLANSVDPDEMPHSLRHFIWAFTICDSDKHTFRGHCTMYKGLRCALAVITVYIIVLIL